MTQNTLKDKLHKLVGFYFSEDNGVTVVWGKSKAVRAKGAQITLTMLDIIRPYQPINDMINGVPVSYYPSKTTLQVDLFTRGDPLINEAGITAAAVNTAVYDLTDFVNYINSIYVEHWSLINDISIAAGEIHDLTNIINDTAWDYRAMVELDIGFTQSVFGHSGINYEDGIEFDENGNPMPESVFKPTASGGRTKELAGEFTGWFEQVEGPKFELKENNKNGE